MSSFGSPDTGFWSIERVVALLTPVFAAAAGWLTTIVGKAVPGLGIPRSDFAALFVAGATTAVAAALKWLHGRQKFVTFASDADRIVHEVVGQLQAKGGPALVDVERILREHEDVVVKRVGDTIGVPPSVESIAQEVVRRLIGGQQAPVAGGVAPVVASAPAIGQQ